MGFQGRRPPLTANQEVTLKLGTWRGQRGNLGRDLDMKHSSLATVGQSEVTSAYV